MANEITVQTGNGPVSVSVKWQGQALAVHRPVGKPDKFSDPNGPVRWTITHTASGRAAGQARLVLKDALELARLWDAAFLKISPENAAVWPFAQQWRACVNGDRPVQAPSVDLPPIKRPWEEVASMAKFAGLRPFKIGASWAIRWRGQAWTLPTLDELQAWTLDSVCERPDGAQCEHDAAGSWLRLLALV